MQQQNTATPQVGDILEIDTQTGATRVKLALQHPLITGTGDRQADERKGGRGGVWSAARGFAVTPPTKARAGEAYAGSPTVSPTRWALCGFFTGLGCGVSRNEAGTRSAALPSPEHGLFLWQLRWRRGVEGCVCGLAVRFPPHRPPNAFYRRWRLREGDSE